MIDNELGRTMHALAVLNGLDTDDQIAKADGAARRRRARRRVMQTEERSKDQKEELPQLRGCANRRATFRTWQL